MLFYWPKHLGAFCRLFFSFSLHFLSISWYCGAGAIKAHCTPGLGEQSGVPKVSMIKVYLGYQNINEIFLKEENELIGLQFVDTEAFRVEVIGWSLLTDRM